MPTLSDLPSRDTISWDLADEEHDPDCPLPDIGRAFADERLKTEAEWLDGADWEAAKRCDACKGTGLVPEQHDWATEMLSCQECRGTGEWINDWGVDYVLRQAFGIGESDVGVDTALETGATDD